MKKKITPRYVDANILKRTLTGWETELTDEEIEYVIDNLPVYDVVRIDVVKEWLISLSNTNQGCVLDGGFSSACAELASSIDNLKHFAATLNMGDDYE